MSNSISICQVHGHTKSYYCHKPRFRIRWRKNFRTSAQKIRIAKCMCVICLEGLYSILKTMSSIQKAQHLENENRQNVSLLFPEQLTPHSLRALAVPFINEHTSMSHPTNPQSYHWTISLHLFKNLNASLTQIINDRFKYIFTFNDYLWLLLLLSPNYYMTINLVVCGINTIVQYIII